jgi:hypothetical protein
MYSWILAVIGEANNTLRTRADWNVTYARAEQLEVFMEAKLSNYSMRKS